MRKIFLFIAMMISISSFGQAGRRIGLGSGRPIDSLHTVGGLIADSGMQVPQLATGDTNVVLKIDSKGNFKKGYVPNAAGVSFAVLKDSMDVCRDTFTAINNRMETSAHAAATYLPWIDSNIMTGYLSWYAWWNSIARQITATDTAHYNLAWQKYPSSFLFNTGTGLLTLTRNDATTITQNLDGRYALLSSIPWSIGNGGTGATTATAALNNLLPSQTGKAGFQAYTDGTNLFFATPPTTVGSLNPLDSSLYINPITGDVSIRVNRAYPYNFTNSHDTFSGGLYATYLSQGMLTLNSSFKIVNATANVDYQAPLVFTTTGNSGAASFSAASLNIPNYTLAGLGGISLSSLSNSVTGLTYTNTTGVTSLTSGYVIPTTTEETNWNTAYANRISSFTTTGNSGAASFNSNVLNIPIYTLAGLGGLSLVTAASTYVPYSGATGNVSLGTNSINLTGSIGSTGSRSLKGWFDDLQVTNVISGSINGNAATATAWLNARTLWGNSVDGTANVTTAIASLYIGSLTGGQVGLTGLSATGTPGILNFLRGDNTWATAVTNVSSADGNATVATQASTPVITIVSAPKWQTARTIGGVSVDGTANTTVATATGGFTISGGDLSLGANNLSITGSIGSTGSRSLKGWFTDLQVTNAISASITGNAATSTALATARSIYGNNFDGTAALGQIIASTYGGTGNGFTKFSGPTTSEKTFGLPNASANILTDNALVTVAQGGTGVNAVTTAATASAWVGEDANKNFSTNNVIEGYQNIATAAGTTTFTVASPYQTYFTGSTTQTGTLPVASTLVLGQQLAIINNSTGIVTVNSSGGNLVQSMLGNSNAIFTCILASGTGSASWSVSYGLPYAGITGDVTITSAGVSTIKTSVSLSGNPTATTQSAADNSTKIATTAYVDVNYSDQSTAAASYTTSVTPTSTIATSKSVVYYDITAQAGALLFNNPSGIWANHQILFFRVKDNATARALTYGTKYRAGTDVTPLPVTTTLSKTLYMEFIYNSTDDKYDLMGKADGF